MAILSLLDASFAIFALCAYNLKFSGNALGLYQGHMNEAAQRLKKVTGLKVAQLLHINYLVIMLNEFKHTHKFKNSLIILELKNEEKVT